MKETKPSKKPLRITSPFDNSSLKTERTCVAKREEKNPTFDEIVFNILPLLKNGITPENQTILKVLEDIGEHIGHDRWRLHKGGQRDLFF